VEPSAVLIRRKTERSVCRPWQVGVGPSPSDAESPAQQSQPV
jgi:hypothetical protein